MKNIYDFHVREIHITDRTLRFRVSNIDQAIEALELALSGLNVITPEFPEMAYQLSNKPVKRHFRHYEYPVEMVAISMVKAQVEGHKDMYFIKLLSKNNQKEYVFFNEEELPNVKARLLKLANRFKKERDKFLKQNEVSENPID